VAAEHELDLWATSNVFRAGHRIRLQVTSSCFPRWDRNLNTGERVGEGTRMEVARQTIFHDAVTRPFARRPDLSSRNRWIAQ